MKKKLRTIVLMGAITASSLTTKAQVSSLSNTGVSTDYLGWASGQNFDLQVAHKGAYNINFSTSGSQRATILANGKMGIGVAAPVNILDVEGGVAIGSGYSGTNTAPTNGAIIEGQVAIGSSAPIQVAQTGSPSKVTIAEITNNTVLHIKEYANTTALPLLVLGKSRGTSIGSEVATQSNDIFGALVFEGVNSNTSNAPAVGGSIRMYQDGAGGATFIPGRFEFWTATAAAAPAVKMTLTSGGNLGINTTAPSQKLEVSNGNILLSNIDNTARELRFAEPSSGGTNYTSFKAAVQGGNITYTLPGATGATGTYLQTDASGNLTWSTAPTGASGATGVTGATGAIGVTGATGVAGSVNAWGITGTSGTVDGTNFIGTIDNVPFNIRVNNQPAGRIDNTSKNTFYGYKTGNGGLLSGNNTAIGNEALYSNSYGNHNCATGMEALYSNKTGHANVANGDYSLRANIDGGQNVAIGDHTLYSNTEGYYNVGLGSGALEFNTIKHGNTAVGYQALRNNTQEFNTAVGYKSLISNTTGIYNSAVGANTLSLNTTGDYNTANGAQTLKDNVTGSYNTANGFGALTQNSAGDGNTGTGVSTLAANTSGNENSAHGRSALVSNTTGSYNTASGGIALAHNTTGYNNTAIGYYAGGNFGLTTDTACTFVGYGATASANYKNASAFGNEATALARNTMYLGNVDVLGIYTVSCN